MAMIAMTQRGRRSLDPLSLPSFGVVDQVPALKVLLGDIRVRARDIIRQVCAENDVKIIHGVLSSDHVHRFVSISPKSTIADIYFGRDRSHSERKDKDQETDNPATPLATPKASCIINYTNELEPPKLKLL